MRHGKGDRARCSLNPEGLYTESKGQSQNHDLEIAPPGRARSSRHLPASFQSIRVLVRGLSIRGSIPAASSNTHVYCSARLPRFSRPYRWSGGPQSGLQSRCGRSRQAPLEGPRPAGLGRLARASHGQLLPSPSTVQQSVNRMHRQWDLLAVGLSLRACTCPRRVSRQKRTTPNAWAWYAVVSLLGEQVRGAC